MHSPRMLMFSATLLAAVGLVESAVAQAYPSRPVTIVVPFPAGGPTDTIARIMAEGVRPSLGQSVIIENVAGASGSIGTGRVARAPSDGYTIGLGLWTGRSFR
jgi:tripartite-type tricarboxylate transporter receptor subunit TctC